MTKIRKLARGVTGADLETELGPRTLVDKAKKIPAGKGGAPFSEAMFELAMAWAGGEVTAVQVLGALGTTAATTNARLAQIFAQAVSLGKLSRSK